MKTVLSLVGLREKARHFEDETTMNENSVPARNVAEVDDDTRPGTKGNESKLLVARYQRDGYHQPNLEVLRMLLEEKGEQALSRVKLCCDAQEFWLCEVAGTVDVSSDRSCHSDRPGFMSTTKTLAFLALLLVKVSKSVLR